MRKKNFWLVVALVNFSVVAFLGFVLRSKILFPLKFINHEHFINAHSHLAFGGWLTLSFLTLFVHLLLDERFKNKPIYQWLFGILQVAVMGMAVSLAIQGYKVTGIIFSTSFIFTTYVFSWHFLKDLYAGDRKDPWFILAVFAIIYLVISSAGPFTLAYVLASKSTNAILYRDALYYYLHFQYNGFFTLSVFTIFFVTYYKWAAVAVDKNAKRFAYFLVASVIPSFFLSLLWHPHDELFKWLAGLGILLILAMLYYFFILGKQLTIAKLFTNKLGRALWIMVLVSFVVKSFLQMGTIYPPLGHAVFGLRPIIIGFLHLIFLGLCTFFLLAYFLETGIFSRQYRFAKVGVGIFAAAVIAQETILLVQGIGLLLRNANPVYNWYLWIAAIFLFLGALLTAIAGVRSYLLDRSALKVPA